MSSRDIRLFVDDIIESIDAISEFTKDISYETYISDRKTYSATLREFIVIGEAIVNIPDDIKERFPGIEWQLIKDFRNFIVHEYFGIDNRIVWDAIVIELPLLRKEVLKLAAEIDK
jgi:uncharacterized protein with HEPN domain